jgi:hypothetical protein
MPSNLGKGKRGATHVFFVAIAFEGVSAGEDVSEQTNSL